MLDQNYGIIENKYEICKIYLKNKIKYLLLKTN